MNGHEHCPHCGERPLRSVYYRWGARAAERIIAATKGDTKRIASWLGFVRAFHVHANPVEWTINDFLEGACDTLAVRVEAGGMNV